MRHERQDVNEIHKATLTYMPLPLFYLSLGKNQNILETSSELIYQLRCSVNMAKVLSTSMLQHQTAYPLYVCQPVFSFNFELYANDVLTIVTDSLYLVIALQPLNIRTFRQIRKVDRRWISI